MKYLSLDSLDMTSDKRSGAERSNATNDEGTEHLEYYSAQQQTGKARPSKADMVKKVSQPTTRKESLQSKSDGYVPLNEMSDSDLQFERYQEITFAQKASDRAKQNPLIP
jgi:hypothetical protein